jgi:uncharacterized protein YdiU (UPF0061 family)
MSAWLASWRARHERERQSAHARRALMESVNPIFTPRNHRVEQALELATGGNFTAFDRLLEAVQRPFEARADMIDLAQPPKAEERVLQTFCGT